MQIAPPAARFRKCVIDKDTITRPDPGNEELAVFSMLKILFLHSLIEDVITLVLRFNLRSQRRDAHRACRDRLMFHTWIDNGDYLDSLLAELFRKSFRVGKTLSIERENAVALHVIDVEMHHIERQIALAVLMHHLLDHPVGVVTPAAL